MINEAMSYAKEMDMRAVKMTAANRFKEVLCVVFGHEWNSYGVIRDDDGRILEEHSECGRCGLENHDRSGYLRK